MTCAWQVEIDPYCQRVLRKHWPNVKRHDDIRTFEPTPVDVVCGGFPCQDISTSGEGKGIEGDRSGLWSEYERIVRTIRPRFVVVENVAALRFRGLDRVLGGLAACGYDAEWGTVSACSMGAPHMRKRLFIVAHTEGEGLAEWPIEASAAEGRGGVDRRFERCSWWSAEPDVGRVANGVPRRVDRLRGLGNAVVPQVAEWIGRRLMEFAV